jgi:uncharacterized membrane protein HdeD (DUF308 family)
VRIFTTPLYRLPPAAMVTRGVLAVVMAIVAVEERHLSIRVIVTLFGLYAFADGFIANTQAIVAARRHRLSWPSFVEGTLDIAVGVFSLVRPLRGIQLVLVVIAVRSVFMGATELGIAGSPRVDGERRWPLAVAGSASIAFGLVLVARPHPALSTLVWLVGLYGAVYGASLVTLAIRLRGTSPRTLASV